MLTFIIIVALIIILVKVYKPKEKAADYYAQHPELKKVVRYQSHEMNGIKSFLNLGLDHLEGLDLFSYYNGQVFIKLKNGKSLSGDIRNLTATFVMGRKGIFECTVKSDNQKICFANYYGLFSDQEYLEIFELLSNCGSVGGMSDYKSYKAKFELKAKAKEKVKEFISPVDSSTSTSLTQSSNNQYLNGPNSVFCPSCGEENKSDSKFCQHCGHQL